METLSLTEIPRRSIARAVTVPSAARRAVAALFLVNGVLFATWVSRLPAIETGRGMTHAQLGLALFAVALGAMVAMPIAGILSARIGSTPVCRAAVLVYAGMLPMLALASDGFVFALALFGFGLGHGALDVAMNAQAVSVEKRYRRPIMSSFHALFSTGGLIGAALGGMLAAFGMSPRLHFSLVSALLGVVMLMIFRDLLANEILQSPNAAKKQPIFPLPTRGLLALGVIALCLMVGEGAMADWSAIYLKKIVATSEGVAAAGYAAFSITMALGRFFGDRMSAWLGPIQVVRNGAIAALVGLGLILFCPFTPLVLLGFACVGIGFAPIVPLVFSAAGHRSGVDPGMAVASVTMLGYLGFLTGPPIIGFAAGVVGLRVTLGLLLASTLAAVILAPVVKGAQPD